MKSYVYTSKCLVFYGEFSLGNVLLHKTILCFAEAHLSSFFITIARTQEGESCMFLPTCENPSAKRGWMRGILLPCCCSLNPANPTKSQAQKLTDYQNNPLYQHDLLLPSDHLRHLPRFRIGPTPLAVDSIAPVTHTDQQSNPAICCGKHIPSVVQYHLCLRRQLLRQRRFRKQLRRSSAHHGCCPGARGAPIHLGRAGHGPL